MLIFCIGIKIKWKGGGEKKGRKEKCEKKKRGEKGLKLFVKGSFSQ